MSCAVVYCAAFFFGIAQQIKVFSAFLDFFVKSCRKYNSGVELASRG